MATYISGAGGGGKGGGGAGRVAQEAANTLKSKSYAKIVEVLCEGEIEGVVGGAQGIYLDDVPLQNPDGTYNYKDVVVETREGTLAQGITKIGTTTEVTSQVNTEIKKATPVIQTITDADVDRVRVAIRLPALTKQNTSNGDLNGSSVELKVEYNPNNTGWITPFTTGSNDVLSTSSKNKGYVGYNGFLNLKSNYTNKTVQAGSIDTNGNVVTATKTVKEYGVLTYSVQYSVNGGAYQVLLTGSGIFKGDKTGDTLPTFSISNTLETDTYQFKVVVTNGTGSVKALLGTKYSDKVVISGKTTSPYEREVEFKLTGNAPWQVRVTRVTDDSGLASIQDKTYLSAITSVYEEKFRYPATAYVALSVDAEQFDSIPSRAYDVKLLKIKVPTNYDPIARTYSGSWDGTFKIAWSDNPAWCFYDLITNTRYGLGDRITASMVDKWSLYDIAQYCDELVDNGDGTAAPRYTCNVLIQTREEAYKVLQDMASVFAGITYWGSTSDGFAGVIPVQDKPSLSYSYAFNNSNVVDGVFSYQTANSNTQYNAVYVTYNEPEDGYKQKVVYVPNNAKIAADGFVNDTKITAFGCTSKSQAYRMGRRVLYSNTYENDVVSFSVGADGIIPSVGSVIQISDSLRAGARMGGRVVDVLSTTSVKLDQAVTLSAGVTYTLTLIDFNAEPQDVTVTTSPATTDILTFTPAIATLATNSIFILSNANLKPATFKVVSVSESEQHQYNISAVSHNPSKYGYIDSLEALTFAPTTSSTATSPVTNLQTTEVLYTDGVTTKSKLNVSWTANRFSSTYIVTYSDTLNNSATTVTTSLPSLEILDTQAGSTYTISVTSVDVLGIKSNPATITVDILGKLFPPAAVSNFNINAFSNSAVVSWDLHPDLDVQIGGSIEIRYTPKTTGQRWEDGSLVTVVNGGSTSTITSLLQGTYMAKALDSSGVYSTAAVFADASFAEIQNLNVVATSIQQPTWSGVRTNTYVKAGGILSMDSSSLWDSVTSVDSLPNIDLLGGQYATTGEYLFDQVIDLGGVLTSRLSGLIESFAYEAVTLNTWDSKAGTIDTWTSIDGVTINDSYVTMYVATTNDDPNNIGAVWSAWERLVVADYKARGFKFKLVLTNTSSSNTIDVYRAEVVVDVPDRVEGGDNIVAAPTGYTVTYPFPFFVKPSVAIRIDDMQAGDYTEFTSNTASGFTVKFKDINNTYVSRQFDYISKGYGYVTP